MLYFAGWFSRSRQTGVWHAGQLLRAREKGRRQDQAQRGTEQHCSPSKALANPVLSSRVHMAHSLADQNGRACIPHHD